MSVWGYHASLMTDPERDIDLCLDLALERAGPWIILTGAGISAESGVPTFRGKDGYWRIGSKNYHAQELATRAAFQRMPDQVWEWYLERRRVCRAAEPNAAHRALATASSELGERLLLITQNVDGLHRRAGSPEPTTYEIHGNIDYMRCGRGCRGVRPVPEQDPSAGASASSRLACDGCGAPCRPHVLWFDELYDEEHYRFESSLRAAASAALLVVVGTTGTTNLPLQICEQALRRGTPLVVVDPEPNVFSERAAQSSAGVFLQGKAGQWVPELLRRMSERARGG
jgi:NAD-dependent deacetylase